MSEIDGFTTRMRVFGIMDKEEKNNWTEYMIRPDGAHLLHNSMMEGASIIWFIHANSRPRDENDSPLSQTVLYMDKVVKIDFTPPPPPVNARRERPKLAKDSLLYSVPG